MERVALLDRAPRASLAADVRRKALGFAVSIDYVSKDTISLFLQKAGAHGNKINRIMTGEPEPVAEVVEETPKEEVKEEKKEEKAPAAAGLGALFG